jgi:hypothetical protein
LGILNRFHNDNADFRRRRTIWRRRLSQTNELFVADGYGNRRVIVFDADTEAYRRRWGAYGNRPDDGYKGVTTRSGNATR